MAAHRCGANGGVAHVSGIHARVAQKQVNDLRVPCSGSFANRAIHTGCRIGAWVAQQMCDNSHAALRGCPRHRELLLCSRIASRIHHQAFYHRVVRSMESC